MEQYYLRITERGTTFAEKIEIDEAKDLEYFHVPAHNDVTEAADYLYDFKNVSQTTERFCLFKVRLTPKMDGFWEKNSSEGIVGNSELF